MEIRCHLHHWSACQSCRSKSQVQEGKKGQSNRQGSLGWLQAKTLIQLELITTGGSLSLCILQLDSFLLIRSADGKYAIDIVM